MGFYGGYPEDHAIHIAAAIQMTTLFLLSEKNCFRFQTLSVTVLNSCGMDIRSYPDGQMGRFVRFCLNRVSFNLSSLCHRFSLVQQRSLERKSSSSTSAPKIIHGVLYSNSSHTQEPSLGSLSCCSLQFIVLLPWDQHKMLMLNSFMHLMFLFSCTKEAYEQAIKLSIEIF